MAIFEGAGVALVTPFTESGEVNYDKLAELLEEQIAGGTDAIIVCGTTGESATMSHEEHLDVIRDEDIPQMVAWALREANPTYPVPVLYDEAHCAEVIRRVGGR